MEQQNNVENKKKKSLFLRILKRIKISHLILLAILLIGNTYAWFIYIDTVSNSVDVHVRSWKIDLESGDQPVTDIVNVFVDAVYPGMTTYNKTITATNLSEVSASVKYKILEASVMGTKYVTVEGRDEYGESRVGDELTSAQLQNQLENSYPFKIKLEVSSATMEAQTGYSTYSIRISWPYESGNDELDTEWGTTAYNFINNHSDEPCINMKVKLIVQQLNN